MDEILDSCADRATRFAKESKPLHRVLPFKRKATPVGDRPDFCLACYVNTYFSHISYVYRGPALRVIVKNPIAIGGCLSLHWQVWSDEGAEPWVVEVWRWGIPDSLLLGSHLIQGSHPFTGVCLQFHQGQSSGGRGSGSAEQGCHRAGSASISRLLQPVIHGYEASGAGRPVIDLSTLNLRIQRTSFRMETLQSVLLSVRPGDWVVSLDLKDAYLQVPMHPDSRKFLRFMVGGRCTSSRYFASDFPRLRKFLPGSWLLCQRFYTG